MNMQMRHGLSSRCAIFGTNVVAVGFIFGINLIPGGVERLPQVGLF